MAQGLAGIAALLALAWALSEDRRAVRWRTVLAGLALAWILALLCLRLPGAREALASLNGVLGALEKATAAGTSFVFGYLGGGPPPFETTHPEASFILAFRALPLVLIISALSALLFHWGILQRFVRLFSMLLERALGLGGAVGLSAAANVFVGMVEAPLLIRPYLRALSRGELFMVMTTGMATIAGTVLVLYASILGSAVPGAVGHLLVASLVATPAAIAVSAVMVPTDARSRADRIEPPHAASNAMEAITRGTVEGLELLLQIVAMLVVFVALVSLANGVLGLFPPVEGAPLTLQRLLGWVMAPLAWASGVPWGEAQAAGALIGTKVVLNELVAYLQLVSLPADTLSARSRLLMTYALCGFANFGSLGIMLGGMGAMIPERRAELASLGLKSIVSGTLATCLTAAVVGLLV